ncbi:MAG TPA: hypothetical protein VK142_03705 [Bacillota bacterium]|nr:hypothetical protein [Bacillota bacterium]
MFKKVVFQTNKLKSLQRFYANVLELDVLDRTEQHFTVKIGTTDVTFQQTEKNAQYHFAINIPGNQFVIMKYWIQDRLTLNKNGGLNEIYYSSFDADSMYFEDPAGNLIELIGRRHKDLFGSLTKEAFFNVSEVALISKNVSEIGEALQDFGIPLRHGSEVNPKGVNFLGQGDTFIVLAPSKWKWYFSNNKARTYPVEITLNDERKIISDAKGNVELRVKKETTKEN